MKAMMPVRANKERTKELSFAGFVAMHYVLTEKLHYSVENTRYLSDKLRYRFESIIEGYVSVKDILDELKENHDIDIDFFPTTGDWLSTEASRSLAKKAVKGVCAATLCLTLADCRGCDKKLEQVHIWTGKAMDMFIDDYEALKAYVLKIYDDYGIKLVRR